MPISIREKRKRKEFSESEILDISNSILKLIENKHHYTEINPDRIMLGEDNEVSVGPDLGGDDEAFVAPECSGIISEAEGLDKEDSSAAAAFYSLGMLIYYMYKGCDWFDANDESLLGIPDYKDNRDGLIGDMDLCGGVLCELTSWDPETRFSVGRINLQRVIAGTDASVKLHYMCGATEVKCEEVSLNDTGIEAFGDGVKVYDQNGDVYIILKPVSIPYRPGVHDVEIEVAPERKKLIIKSEGNLVGYNEYDAGYISEKGIKFKQLVNLEGEAAYRFYCCVVDDAGNITEEKLLAIFKIPSRIPNGSTELKVIVDKNGNGKAIIAVNESSRLGEMCEFKI